MKKLRTTKWWTVIVRYEDAPQTCADWHKAVSAEQAVIRTRLERGEGAEIIAVLPNRSPLAWSPEEESAA